MTQPLTVFVSSAELMGERRGVGAGTLFLHAGVADRRMWQGQLAALQADFFVAAYDRRGFGETQCQDEAFSHTDDLEAVLDFLDLESVTLVGCSQGGRVALDFALENPERVTSLILVAPAVSGAPEPSDVPAEIESLLEDLAHAEDAGDVARVNQIEAHLWLDGPLSPEGRVGGEIRDLFLEMNGAALRAPELTQEREPPSAFERLTDLSMPTLVLWGDLDFPHVQERCRQLANTIPDAKAREMKGAAHLPSLEQPDVFNQALLDFLNEATS